MNQLANIGKKFTWGVSLVFVMATKAFAVIQKPANVPTTFQDVSATVRTIFNTIIIVASVAFVVLFLVGGIQYLTASGNEETSGKARKILLDAVIGLVIVLAAWGIGSWIINILTEGQVQVGGA